MAGLEHLNGKYQKSGDYFNYDSPMYDNENALVDVIITEIYNKYGVCMDYYITSYDVKYDRIWGEDNNRRYERTFPVMVFYTLPKEDKIWSKFGIEGTDEIVLWISKRHYTDVSRNSNGVSYERPQIGDIIRSQYNNYFYEVTEVSEDTGMYFQSKQHLWELNVRPMKDEFIDTTAHTEDSAIADVVGLEDIFDIRTDVDIEKEEIIYEPEPTEKPKDDPFGNW